MTTTFAGSPFALDYVDGVGSAARFVNPAGLAFDQGDYLYVADSLNHCIRRVDTLTAKVETFVGNPTVSGTVDGVGLDAQLDTPWDVSYDGVSKLYVATFTGIRMIDIPTRAATSLGWQPGVGPDGSYRISVGPDSLFISYAAAILAGPPPQGGFSVLAGRSGVAGELDGVGAAARFAGPAAMAWDRGNLYVGGQSVRVVEKDTAAVKTLVGRSAQTGAADGIGADSRFYGPAGLGVAADGSVYVADTYNETVRRVEPGGRVSTVAGSAGNAGTVDGVAEEAKF